MPLVGNAIMATANKNSSLPPNLPPIGLSRLQAAEYLGIGTTLFDRLVADGRMPKPKRIDGRMVWDRRRLDQAFTELDEAAKEHNPWDYAC